MVSEKTSEFPALTNMLEAKPLFSLGFYGTFRKHHSITEVVIWAFYGYQDHSLMRATCRLDTVAF